MKQLLFLLFSICPGIILSQQNTARLSDDHVEIRMKITDANRRPLATQVIVQYAHPVKKIKAVANDSGMAVMVVKTGMVYNISIPSSDDYYEYEIPEFAASPVEVNFLFHPKSRAQREISIMIYASDITLSKISVKSELGEKIILPVSNRKVLLPVEEEVSYQLLSTGDLQIDSSRIKIGEGAPLVGYVLYFTEKNKAVLQAVYPGKSYVMLNLLDPKKKPINKPETIYVKNICNGKVNTWKTNPNGSFFTSLSTHEQLELSLQHHSGVFTLTTGGGGKEIDVKEVRLAYGSTDQQEQATKLSVQEFLYKDRMSVWDSKDQKTNIISDMVNFDKQKDNYTNVIMGKSYKVIPDTCTDFIKTGDEICSVLNRHKYRWKNRVIVTDTRTTMYIKLKELSYWRGIEEDENNRSDYMIIGNHNIPIPTARGVRISDSIFSLMLSNKLKGREGSPLVNGLIEAVIHFGKQKEIVLVADAGLPVSDLALLGGFKVPVKVLVCGVDKSVIDPAYFEIAQRTGGSLHTITHDFTMLGKMPEGKTIEISGRKYRKTGNSFKFVCDN